MLVKITSLEITTEAAFYAAHPNVSFPAPLTDEILAPFGHATITPTTPPAYDSWTHVLTEGTPEQRNGKWYQTWVMESVTHTPEEEAQRLADAKAAKLSEINAACQRALESLTPTYPERELTTFDKQETEARAYLADTTAFTPLLSALATARGIELADLVQRVIAKADAFAAASGAIIGQRQALEDRLDAAQTLEDVQAITVA